MNAMLSDNALRKLLDAANNPVISLASHWYLDAAEIAELEPLGLVQPDGGIWYSVSATGYDFAEANGVSVWRFNLKMIA